MQPQPRGAGRQAGGGWGEGGINELYPAQQV